MLYSKHHLCVARLLPIIIIILGLISCSKQDAAPNQTEQPQTPPKKENLLKSISTGSPSSEETVPSPSPLPSQEQKKESSSAISPPKPESSNSTPSPNPPAISKSTLSSTATPRIIVKPGETISSEVDEKRVEEISKLLSQHPTGLGEPISNRSAWEAAFTQSSGIIAIAEKEQKESIPDLPDDLYLLYTQKGSRGEYEAPYKHRTKRLTDFVLAECIENKGRFLPSIEAELEAILNEKTWTMPAHDAKLLAFNGTMLPDLGACMRAWNLGTVDYLLGDRLQASTREKIRKEVTRRVLQPYKDSIEGKANFWHVGWAKATNNWNAVCHGGVVGSALTLLDNPKERAWFVAATEIYIGNYLSGFSEDGYCSEGIGYWNYGFGHYVLMSEAIGRSTQWKLDFYAPEIIKNIVFYPRKVELMPGVFPAFSDNVPSVTPSKWIFQVATPRITGKPYEGEIVTASSVAQHPLAAMLYETMALAFSEAKVVKKNIPQQTTSLRDRFDIAGVIVCRTSEAASSKGMAIAIKAGHNNEHHNHNDVGSFVIALNGKTPLLDPGMENYTKRTFGPNRYDSKVLNSYGHSVPVIAGKLQDTGAEAKGSIKIIESSETKDVFELDITPAYAKSVPSLKKLTRHITFTRSPKPFIEITDDAEFDSPQTFGNALMTFGKFKSISKDSLVIYEGGDALAIKINANGIPFTINEEVLEENLPSGKKARRIGFNLEQPSNHITFQYRMEPTRSPSSSHPVIEKNLGESRSPRFSDAIQVEAENFSDQNGGKVDVVQKFAASNNAVRSWDKEGHELSWKFNIPTKGNYGILLRYCNGNTVEAMKTLTIDGEPADGIQGGFSFPSTGGWSSTSDDWKEVWLAQSGRVYMVYLPPGEHSFSLKNLEDGPLNLDWIALVPLGR